MKNVEKNLDEMRQELFLTVTNLLQEGPYLYWCGMLLRVSIQTT